jgi:arsenical-resistance protein 2
MIPGAINLPAQTLPASLYNLVKLLESVPRLVFYCNSCAPNGRSASAAGWAADALEDHYVADMADTDIKQQVFILEGGIEAWKRL